MNASRNSRWAYAATVLCLGTGLAVAWTTDAWHWFSRSGCLVVVVGIVLTSREILEHQRRLRADRSMRDLPHRARAVEPASVPQARRDWAGEESLRGLSRARVYEENAWEIEGHGLFMLIVGTLVWGFGDLAGAMVGA